MKEFIDAECKFLKGNLFEGNECSLCFKEIGPRNQTRHTNICLKYLYDFLIDSRRNKVAFLISRDEDLYCGGCNKLVAHTAYGKHVIKCKLLKDTESNLIERERSETRSICQFCRKTFFRIDKHTSCRAKRIYDKNQSMIRILYEKWSQIVITRLTGISCKTPKITPKIYEELEQFQDQENYTIPEIDFYAVPDKKLNKSNKSIGETILLSDFESKVVYSKNNIVIIENQDELDQLIALVNESKEHNISVDRYNYLRLYHMRKFYTAHTSYFRRMYKSSISENMTSPFVLNILLDSFEYNSLLVEKILGKKIKIIVEDPEILCPASPKSEIEIEIKNPYKARNKVTYDFIFKKRARELSLRYPNEAGKRSMQENRLKHRIKLIKNKFI